MTRKKRQEPVCDKDCLNCKYPDCVYDLLDADDYREQDKRDRYLTTTPEREKVAAQQRAYYEANREKVAAQKRAYRDTNKQSSIGSF